MALGTSKLDELYALIPEQARKTQIQYTIKIGKEVVYKGDLKVNSKLNQLGDADFDAILAGINGDTRKGQAITITGGVGKAAEKLFYRDSKGAIKVNDFEPKIEKEEETAEIDSTFLDEPEAASSEEMQEALDAFGYEPEEIEPYEPEEVEPEAEIESSASPAELRTLEVEEVGFNSTQSTAEPLADGTLSENGLPSTVTIYNNTMIAVGRGKYPYECNIKDEHPDAMIYYGDGVWDSEFSSSFIDRDQSLDKFEPIVNLTFEQIQEYQDGLSLKRIEAERDAKAALETPVTYEEIQKTRIADIPSFQQVEPVVDLQSQDEITPEPEVEPLRALTVDDFMEGQCFNFALALSQNLSGNLKPEALVTITSSREEEGTDVCIHCLVKARTLDNTIVYLDAEGIHAEDYADERADEWEQIEYEIESATAQEEGTSIEDMPYREVTTDEFSLDADGISQYWATLIDTGARFDPAAVSQANEYIAENQTFFISNKGILPSWFALAGIQTEIEDTMKITGNIDEYFLHVQESTVTEVKDGGLIGPFDSMESAVDFRQDNLTNPKVSIGSVYAGSFFTIEGVEKAIAPDDLIAAIEPEVEPVKEPEKPTPQRFSLKGLGQAIQGKAKAVAQQVQENVQGRVASSRDKLPASAIALLELHDSKLKDPALAWIGRKLEEAKPELISLREQVQKTGVDAVRKGLQAISNVPSAIVDQAASSCVVNLMDKLGSDTLIDGAQHYITDHYVMSRQGDRYQVNDCDGKELLSFTQGKIGREVTDNNLDRLQVSELLKVDKQVTAMPDNPSLAEKVSLGNFAPLGSRERVQRDQERQVSTILKAAISVRGQQQPNGDRVFEGQSFYAKQSGNTIQLSRKDGADVIFSIDTTSKRADTNHLDLKEVAQILKFGAALDQVIQAQSAQKPVMASR